MGVWIRLFGGGAPSSILSEVGSNRFLLGDGDELILLFLSFLSPFASEREATEGPLSDCCCIILGLPWTVTVVIILSRAQDALLC